MSWAICNAAAPPPPSTASSAPSGCPNAVQLIAEENMAGMTALQLPDTVAVRISDAVGRLRNVPPDGNIVRTASARASASGIESPPPIYTTDGHARRSRLCLHGMSDTEVVLHELFSNPTALLYFALVVLALFIGLLFFDPFRGRVRGVIPTVLTLAFPAPPWPAPPQALRPNPGNLAALDRPGPQAGAPQGEGGAPGRADATLLEVSSGGPRVEKAKCLSLSLACHRGLACGRVGLTGAEALGVRSISVE